MIARRAAAAALLAIGCAGLAACSDGPDRECIESHTEYQPPTYIKSGNVLVPVGGGNVEVCDEYAPEPSGGAS